MSIQIIAELSMNHMGDDALIEQMIEATAWSGADFVKFQMWRLENLVPGIWDTDGRREMYAQSGLNKDRVESIIKCCEKNKIEFLTSCFNVDDLDFVRQYTNKVKIPGPECTNVPLMTKAIANFDEIFMSTGSSDIDEFIQYATYPQVCLMHCVSVYPCLAEDTNFPRMLHFKKFTDNIGYSGHNLGTEDAITAIALGAKVIEKHFTIDKNLEFVDNYFSILPEDMKQIVEYKEDFELMMIDKGIDHQPCEEKIRSYARRWSKGQ